MTGQDQYDKRMYLTDEQYEEILQKIRVTLEQPNFEPYVYDSTEIGNKYTISNCGFCNNDYTTMKTARRPKDFPDIKTMKYQRDYHKCPFDLRNKSVIFRISCYYSCYVVIKNENYDVNEMKKMVEKTIKEVKRKCQQYQMS